MVRQAHIQFGRNFFGTLLRQNADRLQILVAGNAFKVVADGFSALVEGFVSGVESGAALANGAAV